eukprot:Opistho-2@74754
MLQPHALVLHRHNHVHHGVLVPFEIAWRAQRVLSLWSVHILRHANLLCGLRRSRQVKLNQKALALAGIILPLDVDNLFEAEFVRGDSLGVECGHELVHNILRCRLVNRAVTRVNVVAVLEGGVVVRIDLALPDEIDSLIPTQRAVHYIRWCILALGKNVGRFGVVQQRHKVKVIALVRRGCGYLPAALVARAVRVAGRKVIWRVTVAVVIGNNSPLRQARLVYIWRQVISRNDFKSGRPRLLPRNLDVLSAAKLLVQDLHVVPLSRLHDHLNRLLAGILAPVVLLGPLFPAALRRCADKRELFFVFWRRTLAHPQLTVVVA